MIESYSVAGHEKIADFILPVLIGEPTANGGITHSHYWKARTEYGLIKADFPAGIWRDTYHAIDELIQLGEPVHQAILERKLTGIVPADKIVMWMIAYGKNSTLRGETFEGHIRAMKDFAERGRLLHELSELQANIQRGFALEKLVMQGISTLASGGVDTVSGETAGDLSKNFETYIAGKPEKILMTGIQMLDSWMKGLLPEALVAIVGRAKERKTTLTLNILLNMAQRGLSTSLLMFESNRRMVTAQCVAMLAVQWLVEEDFYGKNIKGSDNLPLDVINPEALVKFRGLINDSWDKTRLEAVKQGIVRFAALGDRFRIYDRTKGNGSLSDCNSIRRIAMRDKMLFQTDVLALDHIQRVVVPGAHKDYEKMVVVAPCLEELAIVQQMCVLGLSQKDSVEDGNSRKRSGARGGQGMDEASYTTLTVDYRLEGKANRNKNAPVIETPETDLIVSTHLSRFHGKKKRHELWALTIDPPSGLVLQKGAGHQVWLE